MNSFGKTKYVDRNLNKGVVTKAPASQQGKLLVLQNTSKTRAIKSSIGVAAAPTPTNTGSLRNETKGKDTVGQMTPVGGSVWSAGDRSSERSAEIQSGDSDTKPSSGTSKPAPWAKSTQGDSESIEPTASPEVSSTRESIKTSSWTVDSDDDSDDGKVSAPLPTYANPAALSQNAVAQAVTAAVPPRTAEDLARPPPVQQQQQFPYSGPQNSRFGDRNTGSSGMGPGPREGFGTRQWGSQGQGQHGYDSRPPLEAGRSRYQSGMSVSQYRAGGESRRFDDRGGEGRRFDDRGGESRRFDDRGGGGAGAYGHTGSRFNQPDSFRHGGDSGSGNRGGYQAGGKSNLDWSSRGGDRGGMPALRPMVHSSAQLTAMNGGGGASHSSSGPAQSSSTEGMTEEQRALEEARLERELLEQRKRQEEQAKRDAEEKQRREAEARRLQEERDKERLRMERERQQAAADAQAQSRHIPPPSNDGDRWTRQRLAPPPQQSQRATQQQGMSSLARGAPNQPHGGYGGFNGKHPPQSVQIQGRPAERPYPTQLQHQHHGQQQQQQHGHHPSSAVPARETHSTNTTDHIDDHHQQQQPTRILQHAPGAAKMLFDPKSGGMVEPGRRDRGMSESSSTSDKKGDTVWRKERPSGGSTHASGEHAADDIRRKRVQEMRAAEQEELQQKEEKAIALREARAKEAAEREPRTQGVLYRYNSEGELERVLTAAEKADAASRDESRRLEKEMIRERNAEREKKRLAAAAKKSARKEDRPPLNAATLSAVNGDEKESEALQELDEYADLLLEHLEINSDDVLQDSIEFVEVKSRRTIYQEKKENKTVAPGANSGSTGQRDTPSPLVTGRSATERESRAQKPKSTRPNAKDSPVQAEGETAAPSPPPAPLPLPAVPAWQAPRATLVVIGAIDGSALEETEPPKEVGNAGVAVGGADQAADNEASRGGGTKVPKVKDRGEKEKARRDAKKVKDQDRLQKKRVVNVSEGGEAVPERGAKPAAAHSHIGFDTSAVAKHLLGKDTALRSSASRKHKESNGSVSTSCQPEESSSDIIDLSGLGLDTLAESPDILQAFRNDRSQQWTGGDAPPLDKNQQQTVPDADYDMFDDSHHETAMKNLTEDDEPDLVAVVEEDEGGSRSDRRNRGLSARGGGGSRGGRGRESGRSSRGRRGAGDRSSGGRTGRGEREKPPGKTVSSDDNPPSGTTDVAGEAGPSGDARVLSSGRGSGGGRGRGRGGGGRGRGMGEHSTDGAPHSSSSDAFPSGSSSGRSGRGGRGDSKKPQFAGRGGGRGPPAQPSSRVRGPPIKPTTSTSKPVAVESSSALVK